MIYTEYPFQERIRKAAEAGFDAVEFWNWDNKDLKAIQATARDAGIGIATFQANLGGTMVHPSHRAQFVADIEKSLETARQMEANALFLLTDELGEDRHVRFQFPELSEKAKRESVLETLKALAPMAERMGVMLLLEPLNIRIDHPGYFLNHSAAGFDLVREVSSTCIKLLFDIYHMQVMEGNIIHTLTTNLDTIGHIHVADVPGRHEPGTGELNYANIFRALRDAGYQGTVGFELAPTGRSEDAVAICLSLANGR
jgi:hydroxypyruvate isomerase